MTFALVLLPGLSALLAFFLRADRVRRRLLVMTALAHAALTALGVAAPLPAATSAWLVLDGPGRLFLAITSALFLAASLYAVGYLRREEHGRRPDFEEPLFFSNAPEAVFTGCLLLFLATMTLVCLSQHLGLLWVAVEATTLASAPLIYFHRHHRSLEAVWKYLLICSVGIGLALLGNLLLAVAAGSHAAGSGMTLGELAARAPGLDARWFRAAFLCLLVGYGTKMGLAPLHTWLPDAHSEAPSVVSALLSGALLNCAFLAVLRVQMLAGAAGASDFGRDLLVLFGLLSMATAAAFLVGQRDYKRMLAYSSVEHMGILALGVGLAGAGAAGAMLHAVNHSLTKAGLFLVAGNILAAYRSKSVERVQGAIRLLPVSGVLWVAGFLAIAGSPPFGTFLSELTILKAAIDGGRPGVAAAYLGLLAVVFIAMASTVLAMAQGRPDAPPPAVREEVLAWAPPLALTVLVLLLGLWLPPPIQRLVGDAAAALAGPAPLAGR